MSLARLAVSREAGFSWHRGYLVSRYTGEVVRPWNLPYIIRMLREIRCFITAEEFEESLL